MLIQQNLKYTSVNWFWHGIDKENIKQVFLESRIFTRQIQVQMQVEVKGFEEFKLSSDFCIPREFQVTS